MQPLIWDPILELVALGGPIVAVLLGLCVLALTIVLVKIIQLRSIIMSSDWALERAVKAAQSGKSRRLRAARRPAARLARLALDMRREQSDADIQAHMEDQALTALALMRRHLRGLDIIAQIAPLLGLLGTILGMIKAFQVIEASSGAVDPSALAGGIWVALLTTAVGLVVAIPASVALQWLDGLVAREQRAMEHVISLVLAGDNEEALAHASA